MFTREFREFPTFYLFQYYQASTFTGLHVYVHSSSSFWPVNNRVITRIVHMTINGYHQLRIHIVYFYLRPHNISSSKTHMALISPDYPNNLLLINISSTICFFNIYMSQCISRGQQFSSLPHILFHY